MSFFPVKAGDEVGYYVHRNPDVIWRATVTGTFVRKDTGRVGYTIRPYGDDGQPLRSRNVGWQSLAWKVATIRYGRGNTEGP